MKQRAEAYLVQVIAIAIAVNGSVLLADGSILLHQIQQLCVALRPDGLQKKTRISTR